MKKLYIRILILFCLITSTNYSQTFIKDFISISQLTEVNNQSFFSATNKTNGTELWKTDGSIEGTLLIKDINTIGDSNTSNLFSFNNELYFSANDGFFGQELWKTDGTEIGTVIVKNIHESFGQGSFPSNFTIFNNELYFTATDNYINGNYQLWKTDGTENGTIKLYDGGGATIKKLIVANNKLYLLHNGLAEYNTVNNALTSINVDNEYFVIDELNSFHNGLYFITSPNYSRQNIRLYRLDEQENVILLKEFTEPQYGDIDIHNLTQIGSEIYFSITTDFNASNDTDALWKSDGTNGGTVVIKNFNWERHTFESNISNFVEYKNELYFNSGSQNNYTLWRSDGTLNNTIQAINVPVNNIMDIIVFDDLLYFSNSNKLWLTDGTTNNTRKISDLKVINKSSDDYFNVQAINNTIFFEAENQNTKALYSIETNPIIEIKNGYSVITESNIISLESKIDSVVRNTISIKNVGNKALTFSKIELIGQDFYVDGQQLNNISNQNPDGNFSQILEPGAQSEFELSFYPSTEGLKKGTLNILSNDVKTPKFNIELIGYAKNEIGQSINENINLEKEIIFDRSNLQINITNSSVQENSPINTLVGTLSIPNSNHNYSYELASVEENLDNQYFAIDNIELKTNSIFNFEQKNTYQLRIIAKNSTTNETVEETIIISITNVLEDVVLEECSLEVTNLGFGLSGIEFIDNENVIAVGSHGVILKSENAGNTWRKVRSDINNHLNNVQFTTNTIGYAIGNNLLKTEDAGESWFKLKLPDESYPIPTNLFFVNSDVGFVFGNNGKIFKTNNGGKYWSQKQVNFSNYNSAYFFNESKGFIVGNSETLIKTLNGGDTWEKIDLNINGLSYNLSLTNIYFVNDLIGFISSSKGEIIKTIDGGNTWLLASKLEGEIEIKDITFKDENIGYALTENSLYKTINGGLTWNNENIEYYYSGLSSIDINNNGNKSSIVGNGTSCCSGYSTGHIIYTKELQNTWVNKSYLSLRSSPLNHIYLDEEVGFVFGEDYASKSMDGGQTWTNLITPESYINQVEVINNNIYLLGQNNIYKSIDFGTTWNVLNSSNNFNKLHFINEQIIYATSFETGFYKSTDGGVNWVNINENPKFSLDLYFKNENEGYIGTINDGMFKTVNGGITWTQVPLELVNGNLNVHSIDFKNNIGFAGTSGGLVKTIDGGITWNRINKNTGGVANFIKAINELEWFVITDKIVLKTTDGGLNWKTIYYSEEISNIHFSNEKLYLVGYRNFKEITIKSPPSNVGYIHGNNIVSSPSLEEYSINKDENVHYKWTVSGNNEINYSKNKAQILWKSTGSHSIKVTPFNNCGEGVTKELTVTVENDWPTPIINGEIEVEEFSINKEYLTSANNTSRYKWFVKGSNDYYENNNSVAINWGQFGDGKIEVIKTNINSGKRKKGYLNIKITPITLSNNDFKLEKKNTNAFPNPTNGIFDIVVPNSLEKIKVTVLSINSQILSNKTYSVVNKSIRINIDNLPIGIYFVKIHLETPTLFKIIKK